MKTLVTRRMMTPDEMQAIERMHSVTFPVASWDKRFYRSLDGCETISDKEAAQLWRLFIRYRRQMAFPDKARLLKFAETASAPDLRKLEAARQAQARIDAMKAAVVALLLLACCRLAAAPTNSLVVGPINILTNDDPRLAPPSLVILNTTTNRYTNTLSTLRVEPILTPCPECGKANHHERRVELAEMFDVVYATLVSGGQTNVAVVFKGPKLQSVVTNTVPRAGVPVWRQPGQVTPVPPLTNAAPPTP